MKIMSDIESIIIGLIAIVVIFVGAFGFIKYKQRTPAQPPNVVIDVEDNGNDLIEIDTEDIDVIDQPIPTPPPTPPPPPEVWTEEKCLQTYPQYSTEVQCRTMYPCPITTCPISSDILIPPCISVMYDFKQFTEEMLDSLFWFQNAGDKREYILTSRWRENVSIQNGLLVITTKKGIDPRDDTNKPFTSGHMRTKQKYGYGLYECKMKYSTAPFSHESFWMTGTFPNKNRIELDVNEGSHKLLYAHEWKYNIISTNYHQWKSDGTYDSESETKYMTESLSNDFYIYSLRWTPRGMIWYFNGNEIRRTLFTFDINPTNPTEQLHMHISNTILVQSIYTPRVTPEIEAEMDGSTMEIEWIKFTPNCMLPEIRV